MGETLMDALQDDQGGEVHNGRGNAAIWADWLALWNGDLGRAERIIAADLKLHMTPIGGGDVASLASPAGMAGWIGELHTAFAPLTFAVQVAPLFQGDMIAGRWLATGRYAGGFPGATARPGTLLAFAGADFLRIKDGKIAEYWLSADVLDLLGQLQITG